MSETLITQFIRSTRRSRSRTHSIALSTDQTRHRSLYRIGLIVQRAERHLFHHCHRQATCWTHTHTGIQLPKFEHAHINGTLLAAMQTSQWANAREQTLLAAWRQEVPSFTNSTTSSSPSGHRPRITRGTEPCGSVHTAKEVVSDAIKRASLQPHIVRPYYKRNLAHSKTAVHVQTQDDCILGHPTRCS